MENENKKMEVGKMCFDEVARLQEHISDLALEAVDGKVYLIAGC